MRKEVFCNFLLGIQNGSGWTWVVPFRLANRSAMTSGVQGNHHNLLELGWGSNKAPKPLPAPVTALQLSEVIWKLGGARVSRLRIANGAFLIINNF